MGDYLKKFSTHSEYETYIGGQYVILPNVSYCEDNNEVHYNPIETRLVAKFNVTNPGYISVLSYNDNISEIEIDGVKRPDNYSQQNIETVGEHTVKYTLIDQTTIQAHAFMTKDMTSVTIPKGVRTIDIYAFYSCRNLTDVVISDTVTTIGENAFNGCVVLENVTIPNGVTTISGNAFYQCTALTNITIPNSVTTIGNMAFNRCSGLTSLTIGSGVTSMGTYAFSRCTSLTSVTSLATTPPTLPEQTGVFDSTNDCPIYVPSASVDAYKAATGWSPYASRIQAIPTT